MFKKVLAAVMIIVVLSGGLAFQAFAIDFSDAKTIEVNAQVNGKFAEYDSELLYKFTLDAPGRIQIAFSHGNVERDNEFWQIHLFDANETELFNFTSKGSQTKKDSHYEYLTGGTYYVRVKPCYPSQYDYEHYYGKVNFNFTVSYQKNTGSYEIEPNGSHDSATVINTGIDITGNLGRVKDVDFYQFVLDKDGKINLSFAHGNVERDSEYWQIHLFDANQNEVLTFNSKGSQTVAQSKSAYLLNGKYFVRIKPRYESEYDFNNYYGGCDYKLNVAYEQNIGNFEIEPNETTNTASPINQKNSPVTGNLGKYNDIDFYKMNVNTPGDFAISFTHGNVERASDYWQISLLSENQSEISSFISKGTDTSKDSNSVALQTGTYYIRVQPKYPSEYDFDNYYGGLDYNLTILSSTGNVESYINKSDTDATVSPGYVEVPVTVMVNGKKVDFDQSPVIELDRTLVPLRAIVEALGIQVTWDDNTQSIIMGNEHTLAVIMQIGVKKMYKFTKSDLDSVGDNMLADFNYYETTSKYSKFALPLDVAPRIIGNRTMVPVRVIAEAFNAKVDWNGDTQTVIITQ